jgi:Na+/melibiose symporter-like transporter
MNIGSIDMDGYHHKMTALVYAIITLGNATLTGVMSGWLIYFYLPPGGNALVPLGLFGLAVLISRVTHILSNILVNRFAPRAASGRLLYMVGGALFMPLLFVLLWLPPHAGPSIWNLVYLFLALVAFNAMTGVHQAPYEALLPTLAIREKERGAVGNWRMGFMLGGNILAGLAGPLIEALGYIQAMWIFAAVAAPFLILPGLVLRRRLMQETQPVKRIPSLDNIKAALGNRAFRVFALSWGLMWLGTTFTFETLPYIVTEICRLSKADTAWFCFSTLAASLVAYPVVRKLAERYGVKSVYRASLLAGAVAMPGLMLVSERIPIPLFAQGLLWIVLQTTCLIGAQALPGAITTEITTGNPDQQGPLSAFGDLVDQLSSGLALAIIPFFLLLGRSLSDPLGPLGVRLLGPAGGLFLLASFLVFGHYKINRLPQG